MKRFRKRFNVIGLHRAVATIVDLRWSTPDYVFKSERVVHTSERLLRRLIAKKTIMASHVNPLDQPDAELSRSYFCQLAGRSRITAYRLERVDPLWPRPALRGRRVFYKAVDCKRYLLAAAPRDTKI